MHRGPQSKVSAEVLAEARRLYEAGEKLSTIAVKVQVPYGTIYYHCWYNGWNGQKKKQQGEGDRARRIRKKIEAEEKRISEELTIMRSENVEVLARKSLSADSARTKLAVSRRVGEILDSMEGLSVPEKARTLSALAPVIKLLHRWHEEPDLEEMERARGAINLKLIDTSAEQLKKLG